MTAFTAVNKLVVEKVDYGAIASAAVQSQSTEVEFKSVVASLKNTANNEVNIRERGREGEKFKKMKHF